MPPLAATLRSRSLTQRGIVTLLVIFTILNGFASAEDSSAAPNHSQDIVAKLWRRLQAGEIKLDTSSEGAFLKALLRELDIPIESQVLVFSKTSLQKDKIDPVKPRAIYYNEDCYIGWVQGGGIEVAVSEPGGIMQYYLIHLDEQPAGFPALVKSNQCLSCHVGGDLQIQSVHTRASGYPIGDADRFVITYQNPLSERWGGWYVTGSHGQELHMGNVTAEQGPQGLWLDRQKGANAQSLEAWVQLKPYPVNTSDIVALMVLEHQYVLHNALQECARMVKRLQSPTGNDRNPAQREFSLQRLVQKRALDLVDLLLYQGEYALTDGGVKGSPAIQNAFRRNAKKSSAGASLKDFDLNTHMFKYRCSYMIHSDSFKALPEILRQAIYERLDVILSGNATRGEYDYLSEPERQGIRQILLETEPDAQRFWQQP
jgi:hypothetical protein